MCEISHTSFKSGVCVCVYECVFIALWLSMCKFHSPSKAGILGAYFPGLGVLGYRTKCGDQTPLFLGRTSTVMIIFLFLISLLEHVALDYTLSLPLLPVSLSFLCIFRCEKSFLLVFRLFLKIVVL